jgi:beta-galactosidase
LLLNGKSVGIKAAGKANRFTAEFKMDYQPGTLIAISRTKGKEISRSELTTTGKVSSIRLSADKQTLNADGNSLAYITAELIDEQGLVVPFEDKLLKATVTGVARLAGFGTGRPATTENYTTGEFTSWLGTCTAVLRAETTSGEAILRLVADGLSPTELKIKID